MVRPNGLYLANAHRMKITSAEFIRSAFEKTHWLTDGRPEIAFLGRSNVGKSSLLNSLLGRKSLARTSNTPGRTQSINYYLVNDRLYFVDLPGYGYARVPKNVRFGWGKMAHDYLADREEIVLFIQLIDSRHPPTTLDEQLYDWLLANGKPRLIVATKADKLSRKELTKNIDLLQDKFSETPVIEFSSVTGRGRDEVWDRIRSALEKK